VSKFFAGFDKKELLIATLFLYMAWYALNATVLLVHDNYGVTQKLSDLYRNTPLYQTTGLAQRFESSPNKLQRHTIINLDKDTTVESIADKIQALESGITFDNVDIQLKCSKHYCNLNFSIQLERNAPLLALAYEYII